MSRPLIHWCVLSFLAVGLGAAESEVRFDTGVAQLQIEPGIGGRATSYHAAGREWLWKGVERTPRIPTPETWWDYAQIGGFHLWPAPQARWKRGPHLGWPPPWQLDHGRYAEVTRDAAGLSLLSPIEDGVDQTAAGLQAGIVYRTEPDSTRVTVTSTFANRGAHPQWWAHWHIVTVRLPAPVAGVPQGFATFPARAQSAAGERGWLTQTGVPEVVRSGKIVRHAWNGVKSKLSADSDGGWLAAEDRVVGAAFVLRFTTVQSEIFGIYPEGNSTLAVYHGEENGFSELELMSPEQELMPGGPATSFTVTWAACRVAGPLRDVSEAGVITAPLRIDAGRIVGSFGVFDRAQAELTGDGRSLWQGPCSPDAPLLVDVPADGARSLELRIGTRVLATVAVDTPAANPPAAIPPAGAPAP